MDYMIIIFAALIGITLTFPLLHEISENTKHQCHCKSNPVVSLSDKASNTNKSNNHHSK